MGLFDLLLQQKMYDINNNLIEPESRIIILYIDRYPKIRYIKDVLGHVPHQSNIYAIGLRPVNRLTTKLKIHHNTMVVLKSKTQQSITK